MTYKCRICAAELNEDNWHPSLRKSRNYICKKCHFKRVALWRKANPDKCRECASILVSKVSKWDEYKIDISRVLLCCETLKREE